jgi:hypothetical protein
MAAPVEPPMKLDRPAALMALMEFSQGGLGDNTELINSTNNAIEKLAAAIIAEVEAGE